jgi:hypothetical protein
VAVEPAWRFDMTRVCALALAALLLCTSPSASTDESPNPATVADLRCVVVGLISASHNSSGGALLTFYFLGRIDGREPPSFDVSQAMIVQINLMSTTELSSEAKRCGKELEGRALYMADMGKKLEDQSGQKK